VGVEPESGNALWKVIPAGVNENAAATDNEVPSPAGEHGFGLAGDGV